MTVWTPIDYSKIDLSKIDWSSGIEEILDDDPQPQPQGDGAAQAAPKLVFIDMSRWDFEPTPEQEWAVYNRIPRRECVLLFGGRRRSARASSNYTYLWHPCSQA